MATDHPDLKREMLEKYLRGELGGSHAPLRIPRRKPGEAIPLSYAQEQVWVHAQLAPHLPLYNEPVTIHYSGRLDAKALEQSFNEILRRHESWRTSFIVVDGEPVQKVHDNLSISLPVIDLTYLPRGQRDAVALQIASADAREPLDLGTVPLFRARLVRLDEQEYRLYLTLCHIIFDGVALDRVFLPELASLYKAYASGEHSSLPDLSIQYPDYACWEKRTVTREKLSKDLGYWQEQLRGHLPELYLPSDHRGPRIRTFRGSMYRFTLRSPLMRRIREFCRSEGVSVFHAMFAAFSALLQRYSGEERIPIGIVTASRHAPEAEALLGYFLNTVVIPADMSQDPSLRTLVHSARNWTLNAMDHDQVPFEHLVRELKVQREPSRNPLFQALFSMEQLPAIGSTWRLTQSDVDTGATKYDLYVKLDDRGDEVLVRFHYATDLFERQTIARMAMHWKALLKNGIECPDRRLSDMALLNPRERRIFLQNCQGSERNDSNACIHELFEKQAERTPDAVAVVSQGLSISYRELNQRANQVAHLLLQRRLAPEALVGLCMDRSLAMVIALLGILKSGAAYLPIDPRLPAERLSYVLADSKLAVIIADAGSLRLQFGTDVIVLDARCEILAHESTVNTAIAVTPGNLAYVMYTSGSTGVPKGVLVEHGSVVNLLTSMQREPGISSADVLLAVTTLSFDIAGLEIFLPLITGARLVLADSSDVIDGTRLKQLLHDHEVTVMQATPVTWRLLIEAGWRGSPNLKILCGGESLSPQLASELMLRSGSVWNMYGPTETTIWSSVHHLSDADREAIPIGRPIQNTVIYILDEHREPVPANVSGEIYIGGNGVARGYLNRPELTAQRFVPNRLSTEQSARLYRAGDLGRWRSNGEIEYLGRMDSQIKLRGMRIELEEIESVLASHEGIQQAVVTVSGEAELQKLSAYIVVKEGVGAPSAAALRRHARNKLPDHMVPAHYWRIEKVPLSSSGKIDRTAFVRCNAISLEDGQDWTAPRDQTELRLAAIWSELLKLETVGVQQNFFDLGGHSLLVLQMTARIRRSLEVDLPARTVFEAPTIEALAVEVERSRALGLTARTNVLQVQHPSQANPVGEVLLHQLDHLPPDEVQKLLKAVLEERRAYGNGSTKMYEGNASS